jgi:hypothetical protein
MIVFFVGQKYLQLAAGRILNTDRRPLGVRVESHRTGYDRERLCPVLKSEWVWLILDLACFQCEVQICLPHVKIVISAKWQY